MALAACPEGLALRRVGRPDAVWPGNLAGGPDKFPVNCPMRHCRARGAVDDATAIRKLQASCMGRLGNRLRPE